MNGNEPDFLLFCEDVGLVIFEVKDWSLTQIKEANPQYFLSKSEARPNRERILSSKPMIILYQ
ncbi:MAG: hypothetical protein HXY44_16935 [Syntrophaceae bacterium]|nr:hypothetical protein [Syntrophaceae bacterium]